MRKGKFPAHIDVNRIVDRGSIAEYVNPLAQVGKLPHAADALKLLHDVYSSSIGSGYGRGSLCDFFLFSPLALLFFSSSSFPFNSSLLIDASQRIKGWIEIRG